MHMFLRTLGEFELTRVDESEPNSLGEVANGTVLGPAKPLALITYLAFVPGRRAERDTIIELFWGRSDPDKARGTLRQTVWAIRQKFGDDALVTEREGLVLALPITVDAHQFENAVEAADWERAWRLYTGPFLKDVSIAGATGFSHWADRQRARYEVLHLTVGENLARQQLREQRAVDACVTLRSLVDTAPDRWDLWSLLFETRLASGDRVGARLDAEQLRTLINQEELRPPAAIRTLLDRLRRSSSTPAPAAAESEADDAPEEHRSALRPSLIGREQALAALFERWQAVSGGQGGALHAIRGSAGMGKSRLLREFRERLEDLGATVIARRPRPADRDIPYAFAASLAEALADLPGAAGVSPATASVLVDLAPTLSNSYPYAGRSISDPDELLRRRTLALNELLQLVTDEAPLALLLDDLHWMDSSSRQLLASLSERLTDASRLEQSSTKANGLIRNTARGASDARIAVLLVVCYRPVRGGWVLPPEASSTELGPLVEAQVRTLLQSIAAEPPELLESLGRILFEAAAGVPLLTLSALDLALERGWLRMEDGRWSCDDLDALQAELGRGGVLERLLHELPVDSLAVLVALAQLRRPLDTAQLASVVRSDDVEGLLRSLERRGLLLQTGSQWDTAHDRYADAAIAIAPDDLKRTVAVRLADVLTKVPDPEPRLLQLAGRQLHAVHDDGTRRFFLRWLHAANRRRYWRDPLTAAATFLGHSATVPEAQELANLVPAHLRFRHGYPEVAVMAGTLLFAIVSSGMFLSIQPYLEPRATQMQLTAIPTERGFLWDDKLVDETQPVESWPPTRVVVPLNISFRDANRRITRNAPNAVMVRLEQVIGNVRLASDSIIPVVDGHVEEDSLVIEGVGQFRLRISAADLPDISSTLMHAYRRTLRPEEIMPVGQRLTVIDGIVNGVPVDSVNRTVRVGRGEVIQGSLTLRSVTDTRDAAILMGAVAMWGDRRSNYIVMDALPSFGLHTKTVAFEDRLSLKRFRLPSQPGTYKVLLVWFTETEMRYIASATNWMLGRAIWGDGNDLRDMSEADLLRLEEEGSVPWKVLKIAPQLQEKPLSYATVQLTGTVLTFVAE